MSVCSPYILLYSGVVVRPSPLQVSKSPALGLVVTSQITGNAQVMDGKRVLLWLGL